MTAVLKRTAGTIWELGGIIRRLQNLGFRTLPYKISEHGLVHREGNHFVINFDISPKRMADFREVLGRDIDIVRKNIYKMEEEIEIPECTLHEELQPPALRKDVQAMIELAQRKQKPKFKYNSGLDYYPFQK